MPEQHPPTLIALDPDEYNAEWVGRTAHKRQFFLTTPFVPAMNGDPGREFLALYLFDLDGAFVEAHVEDLGPRPQVDKQRARVLYRAMREVLGEITVCRIEVAPFRIERFGVEFGFIPRPPDAEEDQWWVTVEPGNYMAFIPPWDSGEYDT